MLMSDFLSRANANTTRALDEAIGKPCPYCGRSMGLDPHQRRPTRDHILPRCRGGTGNGADNIVISCAECNTDKANLSVGQFLLALALKDDPRALRVACLIAHLYYTLDVRSANQMVGGYGGQLGKGGCRLPDCTCVGTCEYQDAPA